MPSFLAGAFAVAGAVAALAPVLLHLLNRRRYRVVRWGAMDLLRQAATRTRRMLRLRDILLLAFRMAALLLFGLALARPYFSSGGDMADPHQPVHAVVIVDNSLSMAYGDLEGTLLDQAKARIGEFLDRLPPGSLISIAPLCSSADPYDQELYRSVSDAREALGRIQIMDRIGTVVEAIELARGACARAPDMPSKRIVFAGDQQQVAWPAAGLETAFRELPEFQVVPIGAANVENAWVEDVRIQDEVADVHDPAVLVAVVRFEGTSARKDVNVALTVDGAAAASRIVELSPGQSREVTFSHQFSAPVEAGAQAFVPVAVSLTPDRLPEDDARFLAVPVVAAMPVIMVDQYGAAGEDPRLNRFGETYPLRRLLTAGRDRGAQGQVAGVRHVSVEELNQSLLQEARLVVVAGVESPGAAVPLLRSYVEQGGQLLIAAGGRFSPAEWTQSAWLDGKGILPVPLNEEFVGQSPDRAGAALDPFFLAPASMTEEFFDIDGASREELEDLYRTPLFFRAVAARVDDATLEALDRNSGGERSDSSPRWLQWEIEQAAGDSEPANAERALRERPRVLAAFSNQLPFLVERRIGEGTVLLATSGVGSNWNNIARTNAVLMFDRLLRRMLARTLPRRNYDTFEQVSLPVRTEDRRAEVRLEHPDGSPESLPIDALGPDRYGVVLRRLDRRGLYRIGAERTASGTGGASNQPLWRTQLAVNGPARESELSVIDEAELRQRVGSAAVRWVPPGEAIGLEGASLGGRGLWEWMLWGALAALLGEMACGTFLRPRVGPVVAAAAIRAPGRS